MTNFSDEDVQPVEAGASRGGPANELAELSLETRRRLVERDPAALAAFFDGYFERIYGYVRRLVRDEHIAEDITQDIFLHVHRAISTYDPDRDLRPWLFTIATNKVRDFWRSRSHRNASRMESVEREGAADQLAMEDDRPHSALEARELDAQIRQAVDELPDGMRATVLLRVYEGFSFEAIGGILDRNEVAVRKRYSRALEVLRTSLGAALRLDRSDPSESGGRP